MYSHALNGFSPSLSLAQHRVRPRPCSSPGSARNVESVTEHRAACRYSRSAPGHAGPAPGRVQRYPRMSPAASSQC
eukprot:scaffold3574_cov121-Isochrysis_galbana.AAC.9